MTELSDLLAACDALAADPSAAGTTRTVGAKLRAWAPTVTPAAPVPVPTPTPAPTPTPPAMGSALDAHLPQLPRPNVKPTLMSPLQGSNVGALIKKATGGATILQIPEGTYWWEIVGFHPASPVIVAPAPGAKVTLNVGSTDRHHGLYNGDVSKLIVLGREPNGGSIITRGNPGDGCKLDNTTDCEIYGVGAFENKGQGFLVGGLGSATPGGWVNKLSIKLRLDGLDSGGNQDHGYYIGGGSANSTSQAGLDTFLFVNSLGYDNNGNIDWIYDCQLGGMAWNGIVANCTMDQLNPHTTTAGRHHGLYVIYNQDDQPWPSRGVKFRNLLGTNSDLHGLEGSGHIGAAYADTINVDHSMFSKVALGDFQPVYGGTPVLMVGAHNYPDADPQYVNPAGRDYHLRPTSSAHGRGDPAYTPPFDHDGIARTQPTLGAFV